MCEQLNIFLHKLTEGTKMADGEWFKEAKCNFY